MIARKWVRQNEFQGMPKPTDFKVVRETLPDTLKDRGTKTKNIIVFISNLGFEVIFIWNLWVL